MPKAKNAAEKQPADPAVDQVVGAAPVEVAPPAVEPASTEQAVPVVASSPEPVQLMKARVLCECSLGKANDVVLVDEATLQAMKDGLDADPAAVAYAESLA